MCSVQLTDNVIICRCTKIVILMFPLLFSDNIVFVVNASTRYQEIIGIGASVTDSSCININNLPDEAHRRQVYLPSQTVGLQ